MPGPMDPSNYTLPQQAFHQCLFPQSSRYSTFLSVANPYQAAIDNVEFLGSSGQNIDDIMRSVDGPTPLKCMENTLKWRHIAPTAPDTLGCYPSPDTDPFVLDTCPHVYFAGNQQAFSESMLTGTDGQKTRVICVPTFSTTHSVVAVNLKDLSCTPITLSF